jgi:hypothetical protein
MMFTHDSLYESCVWRTNKNNTASVLILFEVFLDTVVIMDTIITTAILALLPLAIAWPQAMEMNAKMQKCEEPAPRAPVFKSGRPNTGLPPIGFGAQEQLINVT